MSASFSEMIRKMQLEFSKVIDPTDRKTIGDYLENAGLEVGMLIKPARALQQYRSNLIQGHLATLQRAYPETERLLGAENFQKLAGSYIQIYGAVDGNGPEMIYGYGRLFSGHIAGQYCGELNTSEAADVARLDWLMHESYYEEDVSPAGFEGIGAFLAGQDSGGLLGLVPSFRLMETGSSSTTLKAVWKSDGTVRVGDVETEIEAIIRAIFHGLDRSAVMTSFCNSTDESQLFTEFLSVAVQRQWLFIRQ